MMIDKLKPSLNCIALIEQSESFRSKPYLCPAGVPTIGFGSTRYEDNSRVKLTDHAITIERARDIMQWALKDFASAVIRYVKTDINQNQFDALVDFAYNVGSQNLRTSTLLKHLNRGDKLLAANEFDKWVYADGVKMGGLVKRRTLEKQLFLKEVK